MIIATAGHVDHGKSLLVKNLTETDPDRLQEEKDRGLSIDLGFAYATIDGQTLGFVDVPGHKKFIHNMLAGIGAIDLALLVVAADEGPMPQTLEHLSILSLLKIDQIAVVMTRIDRCSIEKTQESIIQTQNLVEERISFPFEIFSISNTKGTGLLDLKEFLIKKSKSLKARPDRGCFRLAIDRSFTIKGAGLVVTGSVFSGKISLGDEVTLLPLGKRAKVRGLHCQNQKAEQAVAGERCAMNISGIDLNNSDIHRGDWVTSTPSLETSTVLPSKRIDARINLLDHKHCVIKHGTRLHLHSAANHIIVHAYPINQKILKQNQSGLVEFKFNRPTNFWIGDQLIIRDESSEQTIGGGIVLDPLPEDIKINRKLRSDRLESIEIADYLTYLRSFRYGLRLSKIQSSLNHDRQQTEEWLNEINPIRIGTGDDTYILDSDIWSTLSDELITFMNDWHSSHKSLAGINYKNLMSSIHSQFPENVYLEMINILVDSTKLVRKGNLIHLPNATAELNKEDGKLWLAIEAILRDNLTKPPVLHELASTLSVDLERIQQIIPQLIQAELVWYPVKNRIFLSEARPKLESTISDLVQESESGQFTAADFRDITGIGRNLAIEILEFFDTQGLTLRQGNHRILSISSLKEKL